MGKGKPVKVINVEGIDVEFLSAKKDKYNQLIHYFKVNGSHQKLSSMLQSGQDKGYLMPLWQTEENNIIIKIKNKFIKKSFKFDKGGDYFINVSFNDFTTNGEDKETKGYYLKLESYKVQEEDDTFGSEDVSTENI